MQASPKEIFDLCEKHSFLCLILSSLSIFFLQSDYAQTLSPNIKIILQLIFILIIVACISFIANRFSPKAIGKLCRCCQKIFHKKKQLTEEGIQENNDYILENIPQFWHGRCCLAFPNSEIGINLYTDPKIIKDKLDIFFQQPISSKFKSPIWWLRGYKDNSINRFETFKPKRKFVPVLMDCHQLRVSKLIFFDDERYWRKYLYLECLPEQSVTGISKEHIEQKISEDGYYCEEFGRVGNRIIKRQEYDNGAYVNKKGRTVECLNNSELRISYLSPYNLLILPQFMLIDDKYLVKMKIIMNGILSGEHT